MRARWAKVISRHVDAIVLVMFGGRKGRVRGTVRRLAAGRFPDSESGDPVTDIRSEKEIGKGGFT
jgi:hypothetical protein